MKQKYTQKQKDGIINCYLSGENVMSIHKRSGISRSTIYGWIQEHNNNVKDHAISLKDYNDLNRKYERSQTMIKILQTAQCLATDSTDDKYYAIEDMLSEGYNVNILCDALCLPKGTYYNRKLRGKNGNTQAKQRHDALKPVIEKIYHKSNQIYGPGKVAAVMNDRGYHVSPNTIAKIMHENGWFSIRGGAKALYNLNQKRKQNILNQQFTTTRPNEVWVSDVTYYTYNQMRYYICVIIDLFARKVVAWKISKTNSTQLTKKTFMQAYSSREITGNLLFHSDQGSNFVSKTFMNTLKKLNVEQSFSKPGRPYDNSVCESFFSNFKQEELYRHEYKTAEDLKRSINKYMVFYNNERPHSIIRYQTPNKAEAKYYDKLQLLHESTADNDSSNP
ncbi:MAG: IS3 family transposase [Lachnospiraceae bacterium]|nr:IS3 family transposase [Lachnospiraceae bacterium]